jgi:hypothetical protein
MKNIRTSLLLSTLLALTSCMPVVAGVATPMVLQQKKVNLVNASWAAADTLSQQSGKRFNRERPLVVSDLQEIFRKGQPHPPAPNVEDFIDRATMGEPKPSPRVGQVISGQMRDRFVQLGYKVVDSSAHQVGGAAGEVRGTYEFVSGTMNVSLKMLDKGTGEIIALYNYSLPMTYDIKKYMTGNENVLPPLF